MTPGDLDSLAWEKTAGLLPAIVQHADSGRVLMLGYMNREALGRTLASRELVLFSRSRAQLWVKGATSGNRMAVERVVSDCDRDALLVLARPKGPACHTGAPSCFAEGQPRTATLAFLQTLERLLAERLARPRAESYTSSLVAGGVRRLAQKVGEEGLEVALAAGATREELCAESADLIYHLEVLLLSRGLELADVVRVLEQRHRERRAQAPPAS